MLIKKGNGKILSVVDDASELDSEKTKQSLEEARKKALLESELNKSSDKKDS